MKRTVALALAVILSTGFLVAAEEISLPPEPVLTKERAEALEIISRWLSEYCRVIVWEPYRGKIETCSSNDDAT